MIKAKETLLGVKVPLNLKRQVFSYCDRHGIKIKYFVAEAIQERLNTRFEDQWDGAVTNERLKNPKFVDLNELTEYIEKRKK